MMLGSLLLIPVYLMMAYTNMSACTCPMALMGIAFSLIPGSDVAVGSLHRGSIEAGHGLWLDDDDPEHRLLPGFNLLIGWANDLHPRRPRQSQRL